jgi:hypothetical protein
MSRQRASMPDAVRSKQEETRMSKTTTRPTDPTPPRPPLHLAHYSGRPTWPDRPTLGLKALVCPLCGHDGQRLVRANQSWRDESDYFCSQI